MDGLIGDGNFLRMVFVLQTQPTVLSVGLSCWFAGGFFYRAGTLYSELLRCVIQNHEVFWLDKFMCG